MKRQEPSDWKDRAAFAASVREWHEKNKLIFGRKFVKLKINHRIVILGLWQYLPDSVSSGLEPERVI